MKISIVQVHLVRKATVHFIKVHIFYKNLQCRFDWHYVGQIYGGDFAKFCGLRIYELYLFNELFMDLVLHTWFKLSVKVSMIFHYSQNSLHCI